MVGEQSVASSTDIKLRRAHEKSRSGCIRCKQQRKKCDETKPRCTKCTAGGHRCRYIHGQLAIKDARKDKTRSPPERNIAPDSHLSCDTGTVLRSRVRRPPSAPYNLLSRPISYSEMGPWSYVSEPCQLLSATDLALLSHYLAHTCRTIPFDADELYVLQVGIPNLAFQSKPLMASVLALAAASKAFDLVRNSLAALEHLDEIRQLLTFADQYYQTSLREIQVDIPCLNNPDHILANAALMVLYGLASHCVRIRVAQMAISRDEQLPVDVLPHGTQWIYLIRAAHSAYVGLRHGQYYATKEAAFESNDSRPSHPSISSLDIPTLYGSRVYSPEDGPSEMTKQVLFPIVAATQASALKKLRARSQTVALAEASRASSDRQIRTCFLALEILCNTVARVFFDEGFKSKNSEPTNLEADLGPNGHLSKVSPWLRTYIQ